MTSLAHQIAGLPLQPTLLLPLIGVSGYLILRHLWIGMSDRRGRLHLWVAGWCAGAFSFQLARLIQLQCTDPADAATAYLVYHASTFLQFIFLLGIVRELSGGKGSRRLWWAMVLGNVAIIAIYVLTPWQVSHHMYWRQNILGVQFWEMATGPAYYPVTFSWALINFFYDFLTVLYARHLHRTVRRTILLSFMAYLVLGLNDIHFLGGMIETMSVFAVGFVAIAMAFDQMTIQRLNLLQNRLEDEVQSRTQALSEAIDDLNHEMVERTAMQEALRDSEETFRTITSSAQDAILMLDEDGTISYWNHAAETIFGYEESQALGRNLRDLIVQDGGETHFLYEFAHPIWHVSSTETGRTLELQARRRDGTLIDVELALSVVRLRGQWHGIGILRDITERKHGEEQLRALSRYQQLLLETSATAIFSVDTNQIITDANSEFCRLTGFTREEILGAHCAVLRGDPCLTRCGLYDDPCNEPVFRRECNIYTKDGRPLAVIKNASLIHDETGAVCGGMESFVDVTDQIRARREAEAATRAKSEFLANMSHEIRTPMTAIIGYAEILAESVHDEEVTEYVDVIRRNGEHLLQLINDILDLSKVESGEVAPENAICVPDEIVDDVVCAMKPRATEKGLTLAKTCGGAIPRSFRSDTMRIRQALINLVGNAVKFTEQGSVTVHTQWQSTPHPHIEFRVIDTGIGVAAGKLESIFEPFKQADTSMTRRYGGTGLGLSITRKIAHLLGGDVRCESTPGRGSAFILRIPTGDIAKADLIDMDGTKAPAPKPAAPSAKKDGLNGRILLVEDGEDNQDFVTTLLTKAGASVDCADNGQIGLDMALEAWHQGGPYDVILMDMQMPVLDGYGATRKLREAGYTGPIVALTAHAMDGDRAKCIGAGCDEFCTKPVNRTTLFDTIRAHLEQKKPATTQ